MEGVKRVEKEEMWEFVSGELSGTLQGRREIPEDVMLFDAASDVPVEEQKGEAIKNLQEALIGKDVGKAAVLLGAARFRHKLERAPKDGTEGSLGPW